MGWSYSFWKENFYPSQTMPEDFLREYSKHFNTVEVNSTFYRIPKIPIIRNWLNQTKSGFIFSIKAPKKITHGQYPDEKSEYLDFFFNTIVNLGKKLGPIIFQFPSYFKSTKYDSIKNFISILPKDQKIVFEFRDNSWFNEKTFQLLNENKIVLVEDEISFPKNIVNLDSIFLYIRWKGNRKKINGTLGKIEKDRTSDLEDSANKISRLIKKQEIFGYFSKYYSGHPPSDVKEILQRIKK
jgi:uncharacterized protein YecE (DUF72 family)